MPLTTCPDCSASVSDAAPACPKCGRPLAAGAPPRGIGASLLRIVGMILGVVGIAWALLLASTGSAADGVEPFAYALCLVILGIFLFWRGQARRRPG